MPPLVGRQHATRLSARHPPRARPCRSMVWIAYSEHVGTKRHRPLIAAGAALWYRRTRAVAAAAGLTRLKVVGAPAVTLRPSRAPRESRRAPHDAGEERGDRFNCNDRCQEVAN